MNNNYIKHILLCLALLTSTTALAYDACIDGIYYNFSNGEAIVTYQKYERYNYISDYSGNVVIPKTVTYEGTTYSVTSIGNYAFAYCTGLTSVTIPESVTSIGRSAFSSCSGLTSVYITDLSAWCSIIFNSYDSNPLYYAHHLFLNGEEIEVLNIPEDVTSIGNYAFYECSGLTSVTIPNSVTSIGSSAFMYCSGLTSVTIPNSVTSIGNLAFYNCSGLTSVTIPNSVTSISTSAFYGCSGLTSVTIPNSVTNIGGNAFSGCSGLTSITIPNSVISIGDEAFYNCSGLTSITIPESVTSIEFGTFSGCSGLTSVTIPNSVTSIGTCAFEDCSGLTSITIPNSVTSIGSEAFDECSGLSSVTIGSGVTSIGGNAFRDCKLHNVLVKCTTAPRLDSKSFMAQTYYHTTLYIPVGTWDAYAYDDNWYQFINIRETAMSEDEVSEQSAYTLMDAGTFAYSVYDPVNDCIGTINSAGSINEDNPNHSWQMMEAGGLHYLYNIGAKKYAKQEGNSLCLCDEPTPIDVADGDNGLILAGETGKQWALVSNERLNASQAAIDQVTGIKAIEHSPLNIDHSIYNMSGQRLSKPQKGLNIVGGRKVLMK